MISDSDNDIDLCKACGVFGFQILASHRVEDLWSGTMYICSDTLGYLPTILISANERTLYHSVCLQHRLVSCNPNRPVHVRAGDNSRLLHVTMEYFVSGTIL